MSQPSTIFASPLSTAKELSSVARGLYREGPLLLRKLQHWRPYICPFDRLLRHVPEGASVLDVGCGGGLFVALLVGTGRRPRATGFDTSAQGIALARAMADRAAAEGCGGELVFERRDVADPWPAGRFDVVSVIDVMHHVAPDGQRKFFETATESVAPGGILLYKDMCRRPRWRAGANRLHDLVLARQWIHYRPVDEVETWAKGKGFELEQAERMDRLWYGHELRVFRRVVDAG